MADNDFDMRDVLAGLKGLGEVLQRYGRDVFAEAAKDIKADMREQKRDRRSVTGVGWAPRAQSTQDRAQRASKPKRRKSAATGLLGRIPTAWSSKVDAGGLKMVNKVKFAAAHHEGATVGHGAQLPARPHLDVDPQRLDDVIEAIEALAVDIWEKRK